MASKTSCCGLIILLFIVLFIAADMYNTSYQRSPEVREAHSNLEDAIDNLKDSTLGITIPIINNNNIYNLQTPNYFFNKNLKIIY